MSRIFGESLNWDNFTENDTVENEKSSWKMIVLWGIISDSTKKFKNNKVPGPNLECKAFEPCNQSARRIYFPNHNNINFFLAQLSKSEFHWGNLWTCIRFLQRTIILKKKKNKKSLGKKEKALNKMNCWRKKSLQCNIRSVHSYYVTLTCAL